MGALFSLLSAIPGLASGMLQWLNKKTDADLEKFKATTSADTTITVEDIRARIELTKLAAAQRAADREHWSTAWMAPSITFVELFHLTAVVLDSMPLFGHAVGSWQIAAQPGPLAALQVTVLTVAVGAATGYSIWKRAFK